MVATPRISARTPKTYSDATRFGANTWLARNFENAQGRLRVIDRVFDQDKHLACDIDPKWVEYKEWTFRAGKCPFPQRRTKDQSFTTDEYRAWRNLGWLIVAAYSDRIAAFAKQ